MKSAADSGAKMKKRVMLFRSPIPPGKWFSAVFNGFFLFFPDFSMVKKEIVYAREGAQ
jgi:hypothetical protein